MSEDSETGDAAPSIEELRAQTEAMRRELHAVQEAARARIIRAELKAEAVRAGMIDLDGLKLIEPAEVKLTEAGEVEGAAQVMAKLKRDKPWLFGARSSSSRATPPNADPPRQKHATEMTAAEYRAARADLLRRR